MYRSIEVSIYRIESSRRRSIELSINRSIGFSMYRTSDTYRRIEIPIYIEVSIFSMHDIVSNVVCPPSPGIPVVFKLRVTLTETFRGVQYRNRMSIYGNTISIYRNRISIYRNSISIYRNSISIYRNRIELDFSLSIRCPRQARNVYDAHIYM